MDNIKESFTVTLKYQVTIDVETGEMKTKCVSRKIDKNNNSIQGSKLILKENKFILSNEACELMNIKPGDRIDIMYDDSNTPVIGKEEAFGTQTGNKLSKQLSVIFKGNKYEELLSHGDSFDVETHPTKSDIFILKSDKEEENIDLQDIIDDENTKEINSLMFKF